MLASDWSRRHAGAIRLFVGVRPPVDMLDLLDALPRPPVTGIRWSGRDQWHVTLRFLGDVDEPEGALDSLQRAFAPEHPVDAVAGPAVEQLGPGVVMLPVTGLDLIARTAVDATRDIGEPPPRRPFVGHLTLARLKRGHDRCAMVGTLVTARWTVAEIELIHSNLSPRGARYTTVATVPLDGDQRGTNG